MKEPEPREDETRQAKEITPQKSGNIKHLHANLAPQGKTNTPQKKQQNLRERICYNHPTQYGSENISKPIG